MEKTKIYNVIILDKSGSMSSIRNQAVDSVNETLGAIRASAKNNPESEQYVTLVVFCGCEVKKLVDTTLIDMVGNIPYEAYQPCCMTPLYDAIGSTISPLASLTEGNSNVAVSVTIITDGYENASKEFDHNSIKALIESCKAKGWMFAYIGAEHDVESVAYSLAINNTLRFEKSDNGVRRMSQKLSHSLGRWSNFICENAADDDEDALDARINASHNFFK